MIIMKCGSKITKKLPTSLLQKIRIPTIVYMVSLRTITVGYSMQMRVNLNYECEKVVVKVDQTVKAGETLLIIESMKMEIPIESPRSGIVRELLVTEGEQVKQDSVVAVLEVA